MLFPFFPAYSLIQLTVSAVDVEQAIVGGSDAEPGDYPWQMSLRAPSVHSCGAVIIAMDKGVTAAHCVGGLR